MSVSSAFSFKITRRRILVASAAVAVMILAVVAVRSHVWWPLERYEPSLEKPLRGQVLSPEEYDRLHPHAEPYVVEIHADTGRVLLFGSRHTFDPADPQLDSLRAAWSRLEPDALLVESRLGLFVPLFGDPIRAFGEMGAAYAIARERGVPAYSWEPPPTNQNQAEHLLAAIVDLVRSGERVFVVAGSSHAVRLERALLTELAPRDSVLLPEMPVSNERFRAVRVRRLAEHTFGVRGEAQVFEGTVSYVVEDGHYRLAEGITTAERGAPSWGAFEFVVSYEPGSHGAQTRPTLILYAESAKTGAPKHELVVPLELIRR